LYIYFSLGQPLVFFSILIHCGTQCETLLTFNKMWKKVNYVKQESLSSMKHFFLRMPETE